MVRADDAARAVSRGAVQETRGAVPAHIEERLDATVLAAQRDQRFTEEFQGMVITGVRNIARVAENLPGSREDALPFGIQELGIPVDPPRQAESIAAGPGGGRGFAGGRAGTIHGERGVHERRRLQSLVEHQYNKDTALLLPFLPAKATASGG